MLLIQGVRNIYDTNELEAKPDTENEEAKLVLIGKGVDQPAFQESLMTTLKG
jgi:hypothetical protein